MKYIIKTYEKPGFMVAGVGIGEHNTLAPVTWTRSEYDALKLEEGEALTVITFIGDAIDWELAEGLYAEQLEGNVG